MTPPLAIIQARLQSTRIPRKMLADVGGHPLLWWAWRSAADTFGWSHVVIASPAGDVSELQAAVPGAAFFRWYGHEWDVLGRLHACAHHERTDPKALIVRVTPDDWPADLERDWIALSYLDELHALVTSRYLREHVGYLFHPDGRREINTLEDLEAVREQFEQR